MKRNQLQVRVKDKAKEWQFYVLVKIKFEFYFYPQPGQAEAVEHSAGNSQSRSSGTTALKLEKGCHIQLAIQGTPVM